MREKAYQRTKNLCRHTTYSVKSLYAGHSEAHSGPTLRPGIAESKVTSSGRQASIQQSPDESGWRSVRSSESQRSRQGIEEALRCSVSHTGAPKLRQVVAEG